MSLGLDVHELRRRIEDAKTIATNLGGFDGAHHKEYAIDQMVRMLCGVPFVTRSAKDVHGKEYTYRALGTNGEYDAFVKDFKRGEDGPDTYEWSEGIPP